jgi:hypothetical protein
VLEKLLQSAVQQYIIQQERADVNQLLLQGKSISGVPAKELVSQIFGRVKAKQKLPTWYSTKHIVFPAKLSMEQCSSELTAAYKASLISGEQMVDLTGGAGVDSYFFSKRFARTTYVEQLAELYAISLHNFEVLGAKNIVGICDLAENVLKEYRTSCDLIYLDPARRGSDQQRVFRFEDCTPDISTLLPTLLKTAKHVMIKTAPFLDITMALSQLQNVYAVHVVAVNNECKEVLYLLSQETPENHQIKMYTVNLYENRARHSFSFESGDEADIKMDYVLPSKYIYEPNVAILKSGGINSVGKQYGLSKLHVNSQLFTSEHLTADFPGRIFECSEVLKYDKKVIKKAIPAGKANITTRNFPYSVAQIRKQTGLKDGGSEYLFATTNLHNEKIILRTKKLDQPVG